MFDAEGNYSPPDQATLHALVVTAPLAAQFRAGGGWPIPKGGVIGVAALGISNAAAGQGPRHPHAVLIEHPTAKVGDVLPDAEVTVALATTQAHHAAWAKYRAAEAEKPAVPGTAPLTAAEIAELRALIVAKK